MTHKLGGVYVLFPLDSFNWISIGETHTRSDIRWVEIEELWDSDTQRKHTDTHTLTHSHTHTEKIATVGEPSTTVLLPLEDASGRR
jgi:hypothetical protein